MIGKNLIGTIILTFVLCVPGLAQSAKPADNENTYHSVTLSFLSRRCLSKDKVPYVGDDFIDFSDTVTKFRLENTGSREIYYLTENVYNGIEPVGFELIRKTKESKWEAIYSPARGRDGIFTGMSYSWLSIGPGSALEFERRDVSDKQGEHATSVFLNVKPQHKNRVEIVSGAFVIESCGKANK